MHPCPDCKKACWCDGTDALCYTPLDCTCPCRSMEKTLSMNTLKDIQHDAYNTARLKGLHDNLNPLPMREQTLIRLALIHTEVSEATQIVKRHGITPQVLGLIAEELADTLIRLAELAQHLHIDLDAAVAVKLEINKGRHMYFGTPEEQRHGS